MPNMPGPPPPPPPPVSRGGPPPPPPGVRPPGPPPGPGPQQFQLPMRNSTRFVDVTPRLQLGEDECKKKLTTYEAHTIRKIPPSDSKKAKSTWAKSRVTREPLAPEEVAKQVKKLNESRRSVTDKKQALQPFQQEQVNHLLDELNTGERDPNFEWSLAQIEQKIKSLKTGVRETTTITCYVKRAPLKDVNPVGIYNALERQKAERMAAMNRPPPQPQQQQQQQPQQGGGQGGQGGGNPIIKLGPKDGIKLGPKDGPPKMPKPPMRRRPAEKRYDDHSSVSSDFSDSDSGSDYSSSEGTSMSSRSDRRYRKQSNHKGQRRSHSRLREHRRQYYIDDMIHHPQESRVRDSFGGGPIPSYVPDVPRAIPSVPNFDPVAAAYQAGKIDADAERFGLDRVPRIRPIAADRAVVSYGRPEARYLPEPRYEPRYDPRYVDDLDDLRYREDEFRRREAEDYMERRSSEPRVEYIARRATEPRVIYTNPFAPAPPRRYAPSHDSFI